MRQIAERYLKEAEREGDPVPSVEELKTRVKSINKYRCAAVFGAVSIVLYTLLYFFNNDLTHIAQDTHSGHKTWFFLPIVIALVFSLIHGKFTSYFWDALDVKAKQ